jgi:ribulose-5-phosphate 4-epimerase/fuculose-1-phosphate aldolase
MDSNDVLARKLNTAWKFFYRRGYIDGFGHLSARTEDPNRILLARHNLEEESTPDDFVLCDLDGNSIGHDKPLPGEAPIHFDIMKARPDVGAVAHFHVHHATSFGMCDTPLKPTYFLASIFRSGVPVHPDSRLISNSERGAAMVKTLGKNRAIILKAHGIVVVGKTVEDMTAATYILEDNARRAFISATLGKLEFMSDAAMAEIEHEIVTNGGPFRRIWRLCEIEAEKADRERG